MKLHYASMLPRRLCGVILSFSCSFASLRFLVYTWYLVYMFSPCCCLLVAAPLLWLDHLVQQYYCSSMVAELLSTPTSSGNVIVKGYFYVSVAKAIDPAVAAV